MTYRLPTTLVASLALPPDVAALARPRDVAAGLGAVGDEDRALWRTVGLAFAPLLALLLGLARLASTRARRAGGAA